MKNTHVNHKAFTLLELILCGFILLAALGVIGLIVGVVTHTSHSKPLPALSEAQAEPQAQPQAPQQVEWAGQVKTIPNDQNNAVRQSPVAVHNQSDWGYIPEDGHKAFWIWGLFFPRLTILFTHMNGIPLPHSPIGYWWKWWMALIIPRALFIVWLFQNGYQQSLWMILHVIFLIGAYAKGVSYNSSRR